jgi:hypothetical protein
MATTYTESFESNLGSWSNVFGNTTDWARRTGGTPSGSTGPSSAQSGSYYIYVETSSGSSNSSGDDDIINYDLPTGETTGTVSFYYHQYGSNQGTLHLEAFTGTSWTSLWTSSGNQGNQWNSVTNRTYSGATKIRFRNVAAGGFTGDVALDNITVYSEAESLNDIYWGSAQPSKIYWGSTEVDKVYFGNYAIYSSSVAQTADPSISAGIYLFNQWEIQVTNNDNNSAVIMAEENDSTPDVNRGTVASGSSVSISSSQPSFATFTMYATAQASGETISNVVSRTIT